VSRCAVVVDDEADGRDALAILLTWAGYEVHVARSGSEAITTAKELLPQLISLDIGMPGLDGYEVCRALRADPVFSAARIYALSGFSGALHSARCVEAGFTALLTKPLDPNVLAALN
jgi:CheY-like chemotaxis protein